MKSSLNRQHLETIRKSSCYPTFRGFVQVLTLLGYLGSATLVVVGLISGQLRTVLIAVAGGIVAALLVRTSKEGSLMLADLADVTIASSARADVPSSLAELEAIVAPAPIAAAAPISDEDAMAKYGITFDGGKFHYQSYRYDRLSDAVAYAKHDSRA